MAHVKVNYSPSIQMSMTKVSEYHKCHHEERNLVLNTVLSACINGDKR